MSWVTLCKTDEVPDQQGKPVDIDGYRLAVFADAGTFSVLDSTCRTPAKALPAVPSAKAARSARSTSGRSV